MSTPTPRTNRAWNACGGDTAEAAWSFARKLESELAIETERATHYRDEWQKERAKVRTLREACESIEEQWDKNHSANPFHAGNVMQSHAMRALAATEDAQ